MFLSLGELYKEPAILEYTSRYVDLSGPNLEDTLQDIGDIAHADNEEDLLAYVEALPEDGRFSQRERMAHLIGSLPMGIVASNLGERTLAWSYVNSDYRRRRTMGEHLEEEGYDSTFFARSREQAYRDSSNPSASDILAHYNTMEFMVGGGVERLDLGRALKESGKEGITLSEKRAADYEVALLHSDSEFYDGNVVDWKDRGKLRDRQGVRYSIWLDTPTGFAVNYKGVPQFAVGVNAQGPDELQIRQLQRVFGKTFQPGEKYYSGIKPPRGLMPLDWEKLAVKLTAQLAYDMGMENVGIIAGNKVPGGKVSMSTEKAIEHYDVPAKRLGFAQGDNGNWHAPVSSFL